MSHVADGQYDVYDERCVEARKPHRCEACEEGIEAGHVYVRVHVVFNGSAETIKRCVRCQRIHEHLRTLGDGYDVWPDERLNCDNGEYEQHWGYPPPDEVAALAFSTPAEMQAWELREQKRRADVYAERNRGQG